LSLNERGLVIIGKMSTDREFRDKWQSRIDGCGPYCSYLAIIIVLVIAFFAFVIR
jgi:hypothetical protein